MLKKLMRYDFKAILKFWWIGLISTLALSVAAGVCGHLLYIEKVFPEIINIMSIFVIVIAIISLFAFAFATNILVYVRFYKHLYSDEGYLTFTLPVKRSQILNSKILSGSIISIVTTALIFIEVAAGMVIAFRSQIFTKETYEFIKYTIDTIIEEDALTAIIILAIEIIVLIMLFVIASILFTYMCISIGSVITRKNKVITAIGIYYGANTVLTFVMQILYLFGFSSIASLIADIPEKNIDVMVIVGLIIPILFVGVIIASLYALNYWLMDKKLNLS